MKSWFATVAVMLAAALPSFAAGMEAPSETGSMFLIGAGLLVAAGVTRRLTKVRS